MSRKKVSDEYYQFIIGFSKKNGRVPTLDEIMTGLDTSSRGTVHHHISNLVADGKLSKDNNGHLLLTEYRFKLVAQ